MEFLNNESDILNSYKAIQIIYFMLMSDGSLCFSTNESISFVSKFICVKLFIVFSNLLMPTGPVLLLILIICIFCPYCFFGKSCLSFVNFIDIFQRTSFCFIDILYNFWF